MTVLHVAIGINYFMIFVLTNSLVFGSPDPRRRKGLLIGIIALIILLITLNYFKFYGIKNVAAEKAEQMYYEEMFPQSKMNLFARNPTIIIPAYNEKFILMHPELKKYFVIKVPAEQIFSTELKIDFADGTWQLSVDERTSERVKAQFSKDGKFVLVSGMKEGNSIINISREDTYGGSILVKVEEPEEWYEKLQEEIKLETAGVHRVFGSRLRLAAEVENKK